MAGDLLPRGRAAIARSDLRTQRILAAIEDDITIQAARVQGASLIEACKLHEIDFLTREAMVGQAMLRRWGDVLAESDPALAEEMAYFAALARVGKSEIIADAIGAFSKEGRR